MVIHTFDGYQCIDPPPGFHDQKNNSSSGVVLLYGIVKVDHLRFAVEASRETRSYPEAARQFP